MIQYLEETLHQKIRSEPFPDIQKLPLTCQKGFSIHIAEIGGQSFLMATPLVEMNLAAIRKQHQMIEHQTGYHCALCMSKMDSYSVRKMIEEGIPFVWKDHQIYLPFLGFVLNQNDGRTPKPCERLSFMTQCLLITSLYHSWENVSVTQAADYMNISNMSATRCFDEIQALELPLLTIRNRARRFNSIQDKKEMWSCLTPYLRSPVIAEYHMQSMLHGDFLKGGLSALEEYSLIGENLYPIYAVTKKTFTSLKISDDQLVPKGEEPACVIQKIGYCIPYGNGVAVDPLSLVLSLNNRDLNDPRVKTSVEQMLEEYVW